MLSVSSSSKLEAISSHEQVVSAHYRKALANIEFYPEDQRQKLLNSIETEYANFCSAVNLIENGKIVREIQENVCFEARSWVKGSIPSNIAKCSKFQVSEEELTKREILSNMQIKICRAQRSTAFKAIAELREFDGKARTKDRKKISQECKLFIQSFNLYKRGFSYNEIKSMTGVSIQGRVEDKSLPETLLRYAGFPMSTAARKFRENKYIEIETKALKAFELAKDRQQKINPESLDKQIEVWNKELKKLKLVLSLYRLGLSQWSIDRHVKVNSYSWITHGELPAKLRMAGLDKHNRKYQMPLRIDENFAYFAGAMYAVTRIFSAKTGLLIVNSEKSKIVHLKARFEKAFETTLRPVVKMNANWAIQISRTALLEDIFKMLNIDERSKDPLPPIELINNTERFRNFVSGFYNFSRPEVNLKYLRSSVTRSTQPNILSAVALGFYFEGMCPKLFLGEKRNQIIFKDSSEFKKLITFLPGLLTIEEKKIFDCLKAKEPCQLDSLHAYRKVMKVLDTRYPKGKRLNFAKILESSGIEIRPDKMTGAEKQRIIHWRKGIKPLLVQRAEVLENTLLKLYHIKVKDILPQDLE